MTLKPMFLVDIAWTPITFIKRLESFKSLLFKKLQRNFLNIGKKISNASICKILRLF